MIQGMRKEYLASVAISAVLLIGLAAPAGAAPIPRQGHAGPLSSWIRQLDDLWSRLVPAGFREKASSAFDPNGWAEEGEEESGEPLPPASSDSGANKNSSAYDPNG